LITAADARIAVAALLDSAELEGADIAEIVDDSTIERPWGWVFFYESRRFLETRDSSAQLLGNAPIIVERESGRTFETGTAHPTDVYLRNYEATGDPHLRPGREIDVEASGATPDRVAAARLLSRSASISLGEAKRGVDAAREGSRFRVALGSPERARETCVDLEALGFTGRQLPEPAV
jgi:hypothetical protein